MNQLAIQAIEHHMDVPLVDPAGIAWLDAKEIASKLSSLAEAVAEAREDAEAAQAETLAETLDETNVERLEEVSELLREAIENCESCHDDQPCDRCRAFLAWLRNA